MAINKGLNLPRALVFKDNTLWLLDQTRLPNEEVYLRLKSALAMVRAIKRLQVRGAPMLGVAAAYGLAVEARRLDDRRLFSGLLRAADLLRNARPTAVNLTWAVKRVMGLIDIHRSDARRLRRAIVNEARRIEAEEMARSQAIARNGVQLIPDKAVILTICNTGVLAAPGLGTALGVVFQAHQAGRRPVVFACETRPLLQGARLTTWELLRAGVPVTLIPDSAAASVIERCHLVLVGADRIALNGDTANKVGTRMLAILARAAKKPFYVVAPSSTFDPNTSTGAKIVIEERDADEVRRLGNVQIAPAAVPVFNPAFDVTPARLITAFITEAGIIKPPYRRNIRRVLFS